MEREKIPFEHADLEREVDEETEEAFAQNPIQHAGAEGAEIVTNREARMEPPATERGYRTLSEPSEPEA